MFQLVIVDNYDEVSSQAFKVMKEIVDKKKVVLGLATGSSPIGLYKKMIADHRSAGTSYQDVVTFNLDEYCGLPKDHDQSYWTFMHENLFNFIDVKEENIHIPVGDSDDVTKQCQLYEDQLAKYEVDIQVLGIGSDGHIGFNEPNTPFDAKTHIATLTEQTRKDNARFFNDDINLVPTHAITMGLSSIMKAKKILIIATGENKAEAVYQMIKGEKSVSWPATILQDHKDVVVIIDKAAASKL